MKKIISIGALLLMVSPVLAAPMVEPQLAQILNAPTESQRMISVVLTHHDKVNTRFEMIPSRSARQIEMMRNAEASQMSTLRALQSLRTEAAGRLRVTRLWINNSMIVTAPAAVIRPLMQNNDIKIARLTRPYKLHLPYAHGLVAPSSEKFTYGLQKMRIPELRTKVNTMDGRGVKVGILDTGIDANHPDLKGKTLLFKDFIANKETPYDDHSHGTHVAGTISGGAASGTNIGVAPGVKLIVGKIFSGAGSTTEEVIMQAMQWIADPDGKPETDDAPALVSNSWGGGLPSGDPANSAECKAVDSWVKLGILPVFAAGNEGSRPRTVGLPAACPAAFAVGATDERDAIASFSSRGPAVWSTGSFIKPLVSAPGVRVTSSVPGGKYGSMSGTSMATPHVAGLAALAYQASPKARSEAIAQQLIAGSLDLGDKGLDNVYGWGRVDAMGTFKIFGLR